MPPFTGPLPTSFPDGTFVRGAQSGAIYMAQQGTLRWVRTPDVLNQLGGTTWQEFPDYALLNALRGPDITSLASAFPSQATAPLINNCSQCGGGQNSGAAISRAECCTLNTASAREYVAGSTDRARLVESAYSGTTAATP